jgi:uncharacterized protein (TIGR02145 family)/uncharacterized repeat protein (TIGR02543 family)
VTAASVGTGAITYSSGTPATATVNATTGEVTLVAVGTTVITAVKAATPTHAAATNSYTLTVTTSVVAPKITTEPVNQSVAEGGTATFTVTASGTSPQYQWQKGTTDISISGTSASYTILSAAIADNGTTYRCIVSNPVGKDTSAYGTLTVLPLPPAPVISGIITGDAAATVTWSLVTGATTYILYYSAGATVDKTTGTKISGAISPSLTSNLTNGTQYAFAVSAVNANGESALSAVSTATPQVFIITAGVSGSGGTITPSGDVRVIKGASVTFNIAPNTGYNILSVLVDGGVDNEAKNAKQKVFTNVTAMHTIAVSFSIKQYSLTSNTLADVGTVTGAVIQNPSAPLYDSGATVQLTAPTSDIRYTFTGWSGGGLTGTANPVTIVMNGNKAITANYLINKYTLTVTINPPGGGTVTATPPTGPYNHGTSVSLTATPASGYQLGAWSGGATGSASPVSVVMDANKSVTATFTPLYIYTVTFDGQGATEQATPPSITVTSPATTVVNLPTPPKKTSYVFDDWWTGTSGTGSKFLANTPVTANITVYAKWVIKDVDGNIYTEVTIGTQTWMVENFKATRYNDGTAIPWVTDGTAWGALTTPGYCWYNNNEGTNKATYGALYNWYTVAPTNPKNIAPAGWHVSTDAEWTILNNYLGGDAVAGGKLKEAGMAHWSDPNTGATNSSGFTALPGGCRLNDGAFLYQNTNGNWWNATEFDAASAWYRALGFDDVYLNKGHSIKSRGFSLRLVRD